MPVSTISQAGLDAPISLTSPTLTTPNIDSAQIPTVSGTAPLYMCRAWVNFNGTSTVTIRASGNVTSITDNGVGDYTVNFTTAMPDGNYSVVTCNQSIGGANKGFTAQYELANPATGSCRVVCFSNGATTATADPTYFFASFFR